MTGQATVFLLLTALGGTSQAVLPTPSAREVATATFASRHGLERLLVDYHLTSVDDDGPKRMDRFVEAFDSDRYYCDNIHFTSRESKPWYDQTRSWIWSASDRETIYFPFNRMARSRMRDPKEGVPVSPYLACVGWRPRRDKGVSLQEAAPIFLSDLLAPDRLDGITILPEQDHVDGLGCYVLVIDGGRDRIWVCPDRGYAVVKRAIRRRTEDGADFEFTCRDFVEAAPSLWLPRHCEGVQTQVKGPTRRRWFRIEVEHLAINASVSDGQFVPSLAPGTQIFDEQGTLVAAVPGGPDLLDFWVAYCATFFRPRGQSIVVQNEDYTLMCIGMTLIVWGLWLGLPTGQQLSANGPQEVPQGSEA
jgi:hypothetical protein